MSILIRNLATNQEVTLDETVAREIIAQLKSVLPSLTIHILVGKHLLPQNELDFAKAVFAGFVGAGDIIWDTASHSASPALFDEMLKQGIQPLKPGDVQPTVINPPPTRKEKQGEQLAPAENPKDVFTAEDFLRAWDPGNGKVS